MEKNIVPDDPIDAALYQLGQTQMAAYSEERLGTLFK